MANKRIQDYPVEAAPLAGDIALISRPGVGIDGGHAYRAIDATSLVGPQGPQGPQGIQGPQGDPGVPGAGGGQVLNNEGGVYFRPDDGVGVGVCTLPLSGSTYPFEFLASRDFSMWGRFLFDKIQYDIDQGFNCYLLSLVGTLRNAGYAYTFSSFIDTVGDLRVRISSSIAPIGGGDGAPISASRTMVYSGFFAAYRKKIIDLLIVRDAVNSEVRVYVNGVLQVGVEETDDSGGGAIPSWNSANLHSDNFLIGSQTRGMFFKAALFSGALTQDDATLLYQGGSFLPELLRGALDNDASGLLDIGARYQVVGGASITHDGVTYNAGEYFVASAYTFTADGGSEAWRCGRIVEPYLAVGYGGEFPDLSGNAISSLALANLGDIWHLNDRSVRGAQEGRVSTIRTIFISAGNNHDEPILSSSTIFKFSTVGSPAVITGFTREFYDGVTLVQPRSAVEVTIRNTSSQTVTFNHLDAGSQAANQISSPTGGNVALAAGGVIRLIYDPDDAKWIIAGVMQ